MWFYTCQNSGAFLLYNKHSVLQGLEELGIPFKQLSHVRTWKGELLYFVSCSLLISVLVLTIFLGEILLFTVLGITAWGKTILYHYQLFNYFQIQYRVLITIVTLYFITTESWKNPKENSEISSLSKLYLWMTESLLVTALWHLLFG